MTEDNGPDSIKKKAIGGRVVLLLAAFALVLRLADLQVVQGHSLFSAAQNQSFRDVTLPAPRGEILDSSGTVLAMDVPRYEAVLGYAATPLSTAQQASLASILGIAPRAVRQAMASAQQAGVQPVVLSSDLTAAQQTLLDENLASLPGVSVRTIPVRVYPGLPGGTFPGTALAGNILGYIFPNSKNNQEIQGMDGVEETFNGPLHDGGRTILGLAGTPGTEVIETNSNGQAIKVLRQQAPVSGNSVELTINGGLQAIAQRALQDQMQLLRTQPVGGAGPFPDAYAGAVVVIDVHTGAILALASEPGYNPNVWSQYTTAVANDPPSALAAAAQSFSRQYAAWTTAPGRPQLDKAIGYTSPPGSIFKPIVAIAALEQGAITANEHIPCPGTYQVAPGFYLNNWITGFDGNLDLQEALAFSCDTYFYQVGVKTGISAIDRVAQAFGLGQPTGQRDLPGEVPGTLSGPSILTQLGIPGPWTPADTMETSIGQGFNAFNPLEIADYVAALANGGTLYRPYVVSAVRSPSGQVLEQFGPVVRSKIPVPAAILSEVATAMQAVTAIDPAWYADGAQADWGTAYWPFYDFTQQTQQYLGKSIIVAAKTGTAQTTTGSATTPNGWFISFAPADSPQIAVVTFVEHANEGFSSGAPIAREIYAYYFGLDKAMWQAGAANAILPSVIRSYFGMRTPYPPSWGTPPVPGASASSSGAG